MGRTVDTGTEGDDTPTERQMEIYSFIRDKIHTRGYGPTVREIGAAFKIRSPNGVVCHLKALERKGMISRAEKGRGRGGGNAPHLVAELEGLFTIHEVLQLVNRARRPHLGLIEKTTPET